MNRIDVNIRETSNMKIDRTITPIAYITFTGQYLKIVLKYDCLVDLEDDLTGELQTKKRRTQKTVELKKEFIRSIERSYDNTSKSWAVEILNGDYNTISDISREESQEIYDRVINWWKDDIHNKGNSRADKDFGVNN